MSQPVALARLARSIETFFLAALLSLGAPAFAQSLQWSSQPGRASDIGVGANGAVWAIGNDAGRADHGVYRWTGSTWQSADGMGVRIDVDPYGNPWVINSSGAIYRRSSDRWQRVPGIGRDVGIGANGSVWVIGGTAVAGGFSILRWTGSGWETMPGGGVRIDVDPQGNAWVVNSAHNIFRFNGSAFTLLPGTATDIGIGGDGTAFITGVDGAVYKWSETAAWVRLDGSITSISADGAGNPWGVNAGSQIFSGTNVSTERPLTLDEARARYRANIHMARNHSMYLPIQNAHPSKHVWYTIYTLKTPIDPTRAKVGYGCIPPNSHVFVGGIPQQGAKDAYQVLFEVKDGPVCYGANACATDSEEREGKNQIPVYPVLRPNGTNCFVDWSRAPDSLSEEYPIYRSKFIKTF